MHVSINHSLAYFRIKFFFIFMDNFGPFPESRNISLYFFGLGAAIWERASTLSAYQEQEISKIQRHVTTRIRAKNMCCWYIHKVPLTGVELSTWRRKLEARRENLTVCQLLSFRTPWPARRFCGWNKKTKVYLLSGCLAHSNMQYISFSEHFSEESGKKWNLWKEFLFPFSIRKRLRDKQDILC